MFYTSKKIKDIYNMIFSNKISIKKLNIFLFVGFFVFSAHAIAQPSNDNCSGAELICFGQTINGTNVAATSEITTSPSCFAVTNSVWYKFQTINMVGNLSVNLSNIISNNSNPNFSVALFTAADCNSSFTEIACNSSVSNNATITANSIPAGSNIWVLIEGDNAGGVLAEGTFDVSISGTAVEPSATIVVVDPPKCNAKGSIKVQNIKQSNSPITFSLNSGSAQSSPVFSDLSAGSYAVNIINVVGCSFSLSAIVSADSVITFSPNSTPADCNVQNGAINISGLTGGSGNITYSSNGNPPQSSPTFSNLGAGTYNITINFGSCDTTIRVFVSSNSGIQSAQAITTLASCNVSDGQITYPPNSILGANGPLAFTLNGPSGPQTSSTGVFTGLAVGTYTITIRDNSGLGCSYTDIVSISELPPPVPTATTATPDNCQGNSGVLQVSGFGGIPPYTFALNNGTPQSSVTFSGLTAGSYSVTIFDSNGCSSTINSPLNFQQSGVSTSCSAGSNKEILQGEATKFNPELKPGSTVVWSPPVAVLNETVANSSVAPNYTTTYTILVTEPNGCTCTDNVTIVVKKLVRIYNVFTPNGDGINDIWNIENTENYDNVEVDVYDRYGLKVFHSNGYAPGQEWNGNSSIGKVPAAVYYYVFKYNYKNESKDYFLSGTITVIR
jgi:gliding motility-associated-like protein